MLSFLSELGRNWKATYTVIVMAEDAMEQPRQHQVQLKELAWLWGGSLAVVLLLAVLVIFLTPVRQLIPGYGTEEMKQQARMNALRLTMLQDSLTAQQAYMTQLRSLIMGEPDTTAPVAAAPAEPAFTVTGELAEVATTPGSVNWADHQQPALSLSQLPVDVAQPIQPVALGQTYLSSLQLPLLPPVNGYLTRGFDARLGHFAVDFAVDEGTIVRAIGDGYVIFADWTHAGGYTLTIQHADGFVSVYKHNQRLLKQVGDRVNVRESIAVSGNSGEITTGPHLHFELWHDGLAQDPRSFLIGW